MSGPSVLPFWPVARPSQERSARPKPTSRRPPAYLHAAAKHAWADIAGLLGRKAHNSDDAELELAAVLLARFRDGQMPTPLVIQMNAALAGLGLSPFARARLRDGTRCSAGASGKSDVGKKTSSRAAARFRRTGAAG